MKSVTLLSNGDFRDPVGRTCWPKQEQTLREVQKAFGALGVLTVIGNPFRQEKQHGFMTTQSEVCAVMSAVSPEEPLVLVLSSWVWAHHVASPLQTHRGPILLLGNFDGTWPGLVSLLNHSATFDRMCIPHSKVWTSSFCDDGQFMARLREWVETGSVTYPRGHITPLDAARIPRAADRFSAALAARVLRHKRILGQFDPGCMGMLNAVMSPHKLARVGFPVELLSQADLLAEMRLVADEDAQGAFAWLQARGVHFDWGDGPEGLSRDQVLEQMRMYIAAGRIHARYGLSAIGIPYQYGLVRSTAASDLPEGMLNNCERPEIRDAQAGAPILPGLPVVHFNEGDLGSAVPQVLMHDILLEKGLPPETTLHDVRWGDRWDDSFVWCLEISGGAPPAHFGGWDRVSVFRQPSMYFPRGGGTCSGVSKPGNVTWARFYERYEEIGMDVGTGEIVSLPPGEIERRLSLTTREWPLANLHIPGYGRDELMSTHGSNHITICYGDIVTELAATAFRLGIPVNVVGEARQRFS